MKHSNFTIDTTSIKKINYGKNITYTMFIKRSEFNENYFENLILKIDSVKNVEAYIVKYTLNSPLEFYSEHESFSIDAEPEITRITLENTDDSIMARSTCISLYSTRCNGTLNSGCGGAWHTPGPNCQCVVIYESGLDCSTQGDDPNTGGGGDSSGGGGGGYNDGVVTAPNVDAYLWDLKNFTSGELSSDQRSYYNSNANIKNNINTYLISKNFSVFSVLDSKLAINVGMALSLDYKVFNWAFKNSNNILERASSYLTKNGNSPQSIAFALEGLLVTKDGGDVDFEDQIINNLKGKANCAYQKLKKQNGDLFKTTIGKFIDDPKYNLIITTVGACGGEDTACTNGREVDKDGTIKIIFKNAYEPTLELAASILHEGIHAELFRYVSRRKSGVDPNDRPRLLQLYQYYKGIVDNPNYNGDPVTDAQHTYMAENYVKPIAEAIRSLDGNKYLLEYYMWYGWEGLEKYDFENRLANGLDTKYNNYQEIVNNNTSVKCD
ncbi:hypothetical protein [Galbibacter sp.]|uniref:hypothetical protein n=1 Tax=Galbibacter sp. TaxID=2918471 RepID=UPI003A94C24D